MVCATAALFVVPLVLGATLRPTLLRAMTFMIVASPCAVVLATMPPLLAAIANAGRHGVLVKSAVVMEQLGVTTQVAFDETGTLTEGTPRVADILVVDESISESDLLRLAAGAEYLARIRLLAPEWPPPGIAKSSFRQPRTSPRHGVAASQHKSAVIS